MIKTKYILLALWTLCSLGACIAPDNDDDNCQECREQQILLQLHLRCNRQQYRHRQTGDRLDEQQHRV